MQAFSALMYSSIREVWRVKFTLAKIRKAAQELLTIDEKDQRRLFEGNALLSYCINRWATEPILHHPVKSTCG
uniref:Uncharacterized protein n=1 Tax=Pseudonaja textilis TaxID=8673 RepID=A0A670YL51_PSETE